MDFLTDDDIEERVSSPSNLKNLLEIHLVRDVGQRGTDIPNEIRKTIAVLAEEKGVTQTSLAKTFDVSQQAVSGYTMGTAAGGRDSKPIQGLKTFIEERKQQAEQRAIDVLLTSLDILPNKVRNVSKAKDISSIAKDMAIVAERLSPNREGAPPNQVHLHIYKPEQKAIEDYEVIEVETEKAS